MKTRILKYLPILLLITSIPIAAQFIPYPTEDFTQDTPYKVLRVIDGDTIKIEYQGKETSVRLIGVDTPETVHSNKPVETYGKEASAFLNNLLMGESVYLRFGTNKTDMFGRLLAYLYRAPDGLFVNLEIVRQGYGHVYTQYPFKHIDLFRHYGNKARQSSKGLYAFQPKVEGANNAAESKVTVYVTRTGSTYHKEGCIYLRTSKIPKPLSEAKSQLRPCKKCKPPE